MGLRVDNNALAALNDPRLAFRLDPGEPGVLHAASASQSTLRVAEQENRNIRRLENAAAREGRIVTRSGATFTRTGVGSFTTTVSGLTRVESVEPRPTPLETAERISEATPDGTGGDQAPARSGAQSQGIIGLLNNGFRFAAADTQSRERELIARQSSIERELIQTARFRFNADNPEAAQAARAHSAALRRQAQDIERAINQLRLAQLAESSAQLSALLGQAAAGQTEAANDLIAVTNGAPGLQGRSDGIESPQFSAVA